MKPNETKNIPWNNKQITNTQKHTHTHMHTIISGNERTLVKNVSYRTQTCVVAGNTWRNRETFSRGNDDEHDSENHVSRPYTHTKKKLQFWRNKIFPSILDFNYFSDLSSNCGLQPKKNETVAPAFCITWNEINEFRV